MYDSVSQQNQMPVSVMRHSVCLTLFSSVLIGGFLGIAVSLFYYFHNQLGWPAVWSLAFNACGITIGFLFLPAGWRAAVQFQATRVLTVLFAGIGVLTLDLFTNPSIVWGMVLTFSVMAMLGAGSGALLQTVKPAAKGPRKEAESTWFQCLPICIGGCLGAVLTATIMALVQHLAGNYAIAYLAFSLISFVSALVLLNSQEAWNTTGRAQTEAEVEPALS